MPPEIMTPIEPILEMHDIQGNIFPGFNKDHQSFLGLRITDAAAAKRWVAFITPEIATAEEVLRWKELRRSLIARRGREPEDLTAVWINIAFSAGGLKKLVAPEEVDQFEDEPFRLGLSARSLILNDPRADTDEGSPQNWKVGGSAAATPDILLIVAGDDINQLEAKIDWIKSTLAAIPTADAEPAPGSGLALFFEERGDDLPGELGGHEHFGFKDGISQPGIRGRLPEPPHEFLTPRLVDPQDPAAPFLSQPGQPLIWPGQFVFGYPSQDDRFPLEPGPEKAASPAWTRNGSLLVFRRLRQDVAQFWQFMNEKAEELAASGFSEMTGVALASLLVGRWPSGAPVMRAPQTDDRTLAQVPVNNHFRFAEASRLVQLIPNSGLPEDHGPQSPADREGLRCPMAAHIRKVNPRDLTTENGSSTDVLTRRILRRGIPFGPILADPAQPKNDPVKGERGLFFLCYQTSILNQFEFLTRNWMNVRNAPESDPGGNDLIVGQTPPGETRRCWIKRRPGAEEFSAEVAAQRNWIIPTGGGYFFAPSITALLTTLNA